MPIDTVQLSSLVKSHPHQRFGQLLVNAFNCSDADLSWKLFNIGDKELIELLKEYSKSR